MNTDAWQDIGRIAKARRERLGLRQDELANRGGPGVSTVGKFERGQGPFPLRTQQQIEKALGWSRGDVEEYVDARIRDDDSDLTSFGEWEQELVVDRVPDLSGTSVRALTAADLSDDDLVAELHFRLKRLRSAEDVPRQAPVDESYLRLLASRHGRSAGQQKRSEQDAAGEESQEPGDG